MSAEEIRAEAEHLTDEKFPQFKNSSLRIYLVIAMMKGALIMLEHERGTIAEIQKSVDEAKALL